ncbi:hypothetical protein MPSI1_001143 [Malassezia psittaci]|uniref:Uncharacterized protein n=1 Tax=Malassezia psittaci TaxID=1821823 RepID=A0AAF0F4E9_9BASI|nr:hypothetical protein MPSI1_001143 [Malassezia psittaci]
MLVNVLGTVVGSSQWTELLGSDAESVEICEYSDMHYYNVRPRGISFQVEPTTKEIQTIDLYHQQRRWGEWPKYPICIDFVRDENHDTLEITPHTTALQLVEKLGEPLRKGGAEAGGPTARALGPAMWTEWCIEARRSSSERIALYIMVEYAGEAARAPDRWEKGRGSEAPWAAIAISCKPANSSK